VELKGWCGGWCLMSVRGGGEMVGDDLGEYVLVVVGWGRVVFD
jgi:hypothetical protein